MRNSAHKEQPAVTNTIMEDGTPIVFPPGAPKRHEARHWGRRMDHYLTEVNLTAVARDKLPTGMFKKPWSAEALQPPPPLPPRASFRDQMSHRQLTDAIEGKMNDNEQLREQIAV